MIELSDRPRRFWFGSGAVLLLLTIVLTWAFSRGAARGPDDPNERLRRAGGSGEIKQVGGPIAVKAKSSTGAVIGGRMLKVQEKGGRIGYSAPHLERSLKEGESVTVSVPGGGTVVMKRPAKGEEAKWPPAPSNEPPR